MLISGRSLRFCRIIRIIRIGLPRSSNISARARRCSENSAPTDTPLRLSWRQRTLPWCFCVERGSRVFMSHIWQDTEPIEEWLDQSEPTQSRPEGYFRLECKLAADRTEDTCS
jgi:hypothetical protein